jgi:hypothetical protein
MRRHSHKFTIADDEAVLALVEKLVGGQDRARPAAKNFSALSMTPRGIIRTQTKKSGAPSSTASLPATP